jgi:hypothetical protein
MARRRRDRPRTDDTNWGPRDDVQWYSEQAKAAVGAAGALARMPRAWVTEVRAMVRDMRDDGTRPKSGGEDRPT